MCRKPTIQYNNWIKHGKFDRNRVSSQSNDQAILKRAFTRGDTHEYTWTHSSNRLSQTLVNSHTLTRTHLSMLAYTYIHPHLQTKLTIATLLNTKWCRDFNKSLIVQWLPHRLYSMLRFSRQMVCVCVCVCYEYVNNLHSKIGGFFFNRVGVSFAI